MMAMLELIKRLYPLRTCNLALTPENITAGKFKVCLEYHIKNCKGPCIGAQSHDEYMKSIAEIREILKGNTQSISNALMEEMQKLAEELRFEEAQKVKEKYELIENYRSKSEVVSSVIHNIDVFRLKRTKVLLTSTICTLLTDASTRPSRSNIRCGLTKARRNFSSSVLWKCGNVTKASRKRSSYL